MFGLFNKHLKAEIEKLQKQLAEHRDHQGRADRLFAELKEAKQENENLRISLESTERQVEELRNEYSVKLTDAQAKKYLKALDKRNLQKLEDIVNSMPNDSYFYSEFIVYVKKTNKTELRLIEDKLGALKILSQAKRGAIKIVC
jgi:uncharacterized protein YpuA (DUF1002 family)